MLYTGGGLAPFPCSVISDCLKFCDQILYRIYKIYSKNAQIKQKFMKHLLKIGWKISQFITNGVWWFNVSSVSCFNYYIMSLILFQFGIYLSAFVILSHLKCLRWNQIVRLTFNICRYALSANLHTKRRSFLLLRISWKISQMAVLSLPLSTSIVPKQSKYKVSVQVKWKNIWPMYFSF